MFAVDFCHHEVDGKDKAAYLTPMTIHLKPEIEALIQKDLERGPYRSADEFVERAVQMLHEEEALLANDHRTLCWSGNGMRRTQD